MTSPTLSLVMDCGVSRIELNGRVLAFERAQNPYREGAARVPLAALQNALKKNRNEMKISLG